MAPDVPVTFDLYVRGALDSGYRVGRGLLQLDGVVPGRRTVPMTMERRGAGTDAGLEVDIHSIGPAVGNSAPAFWTPDAPTPPLPLQGSDAGLRVQGSSDVASCPGVQGSGTGPGFQGSSVVVPTAPVGDSQGPVVPTAPFGDSQGPATASARFSVPYPDSVSEVGSWASRAPDLGQALNFADASACGVWKPVFDIRATHFNLHQLLAGSGAMILPAM